VSSINNEFDVLKEKIKEALREFYSGVFGISYEPRIEVGVSVPIYFDLKEGKIYVSPEFLIDFRWALNTGQLDRILFLQSQFIYKSLFQLFDERGIEWIKYYQSKKAFADTLKSIYLAIGYLNFDRIKEHIDSIKPEERLLIVNKYITEAFLDKRQLKYVEEHMISYKESTFSYFILKKEGIFKFLEDLKKVLDSKEIDRILEEYEKLF